MRSDSAIERLAARTYCIPTDGPEADATLTWTSTTSVVAEIRAGGHTGIGYTYSDAGAAQLINAKLCEAIIGKDALAVPKATAAVLPEVRTLGRVGLVATATSAIDCAFGI